MDKQKQKQMLTEIMNEDAKDGVYDNKPFTTGSLRKITDVCEMGYISYGRMVEIINEIAIKWHENHIGDSNKMVEHHIVDTNKMITAVEWFYQRILAEDIRAVFEQAKAIEKLQVINAFKTGEYNSVDYFNAEYPHQETSENYYEETYNK